MISLGIKWKIPSLPMELFKYRIFYVFSPPRIKILRERGPVILWLDYQAFWNMVLNIGQLQPHYIILHSAKAKEQSTPHTPNC